MKQTILKGLIASAALISANNALACTFVINDIAVKNDLAAHLLTELGVTVAQVNHVEISDYDWHISIPTPMCPEELTYTATYDVSFERSELVGCSAKAKVTKVEPWTAEGRDSYTVEFAQAASCE